MVNKKNRKVAIIFGITGQDGSYLSDYLIKKKYFVIGVSRKRKKVIKNHLKIGISKKLKIKYFNYSDSYQVNKLIKATNCKEIYYFGGQPLPTISKKFSIETLYSNIIPVFYILNSILILNKKIKFFNASSYHIYKSSSAALNENSILGPETIYGLSKLISYELVKFFRNHYNLKACSGIMFQHESPLRNKNTVIPKIIKLTQLIKKKKIKNLKLGNIKVTRDWGWAPDYVKIIHKILISKKMDDYIIATGHSTKLEKVVKIIFKKYNLDISKKLFIDKKLFRKNETLINKADISKIKKNFSWQPKNLIEEIIEKLLNKRLY